LLEKSVFKKLCRCNIEEQRNNHKGVIIIRGDKLFFSYNISRSSIKATFSFSLLYTLYYLRDITTSSKEGILK